MLQRTGIGGPRGPTALMVVLAVALALPAAAAAARQPSRASGAAKPYLDSRTGARAGAARSGTVVAAARPSARTTAARDDLRRTLGRGAILTVDPLTGTPRQLLRSDGALSAPRSGDRDDDRARLPHAPTAKRSASPRPTSPSSRSTAARARRAA